MIVSKTDIGQIRYFRDGVEIAEEEYMNILRIIKNKPSAPEGYDYRLNDAVGWELYELPTEPETEESATEADYIKALERFGVTND